MEKNTEASPADHYVLEFRQHPLLLIAFFVQQILLDGNSLFRSPGEAAVFFSICTGRDGLVLRRFHAV